MKTFEFKVTIKVSDNWIEDGFGEDLKATEEVIADAIDNAILQYAYGSEKIIKVTCTENPLLSFASND